MSVENKPPNKCKAGHFYIDGKPVGEHGLRAVIYGMFFVGVLFGLWLGMMSW